MIQDKKDLAIYMRLDAIAYGKELTLKSQIRNIYCRNPYLQYLRILRKCEYYCNNRKLLRFWYIAKLNKMKLKTGIDIGINVLGPGIFIPHGKVVINSMSTIGAGGVIYSDVTVGITRFGDQSAPRIGKNVSIGSGARILGNISIADNVVIGANSVVTHDILQEGAVVVGIPARVIDTME